MAETRPAPTTSVENDAETAVPASEGASETDQLPAGPAAKPKGKPGPAQQLKRARTRARKAEATIAELEARIAEVEDRQVYPLANPAHMKRRHWGLIASFLLVVLVPVVVVALYLWTVAEDQYASTAGFTVRSQEASSANDLLGGLAQFTGTSTASDSDILYEFIQSQEMVAAVDAAVDLRGHYSALWPQDRVFALWPEASLEDLTWYWQRIVGIAFDSGSGLIEVRALAFDPDTAQAITRAIVRESQTRINALNEQARADAIGYSQADLDAALDQLKSARQALTEFRTRTRIVDPEADIQGRMGVMNNLQQQLAQSLVEYDLLRATVGTEDVRVRQAEQRIEVIRDRINIERQTFTSNNTDTGGVGEDYPSLIAEYESLTVDLEYAEESYRAALTALKVARDDATRESRYLATYITPTRATEAEYPRRMILASLVGLFLLLGWSILALIYYSIRDRS